MKINLKILLKIPKKTDFSKFCIALRTLTLIVAIIGILAIIEIQLDLVF